jgi:ZIP family zinc transporter
MATGIGSLLSLVKTKSNPKFLAGSLGFSAGVMLYISFVELLPLGKEYVRKATTISQGDSLAIICFFAGIFCVAAIDFLVPSYENPHETRLIKKHSFPSAEKLKKTGLITALAIGIHNFPEGLATFMSGLSSLELALPVAVAIALHNIPEGIAISTPLFAATQSRKKAFWLSFASGLAEPIGALVGFFFLRSLLGPLMLGVSFSFVAGIMVFISLDELLPTAEEFGEHHVAIYSLIAGMGVMATSLFLLS